MSNIVENAPAGFLPEDLVRGGLRTDFVATFTDLFWDYFTYTGKDGQVGARAFGLHVHFTDEEGQADEQFYSAGKDTDWVPSSDKSQPVPLTKGHSLNDSSNYAAFITSVINAGVPGSKLSSVKDLIGGAFFMSRQKLVDKSGAVRVNQNSGKPLEALLVMRCDRLPWDAPKSAGKKGTKAKAALAAAVDTAAAADDGGKSDHPDAETVTELLTELLSTGEFPDGIPLKAVVPRLMKDKKLDAYDKGRRPAIMKAILNTNLLGSLPGLTFENGIITFG